MTPWGAVALLLGPFAVACDDSLIGTPCVPAEMQSANFTGFDPEAASAESSTDGVHVCLVNHFRGLTTCPYGQNATGDALPDGGAFTNGAAPCRDALGDLVIGSSIGDVHVEPQCVDRPAAKAVYWSCNCADANGKRVDGMCSCPSGTTCTPLVPPTGTADTLGSVAYCMLDGTEYAAFGSCAAACDPLTATCD